MFLPPPRPVDRAGAVPPGRVGYDLNARRLLLHSFLPERAFETLRTAGTLRCDPSLSEEHSRPAYAWLSEQYARRVPGEDNGPLLWAWARIQRRFLLDYLNLGDVLVTLRLPRERVLLSDFDDWHAVLNQYELHPREIDDEEADRRIDAFWEEREAAAPWTRASKRGPSPCGAGSSPRGHRSSRSDRRLEWCRRSPHASTPRTSSTPWHSPAIRP